MAHILLLTNARGASVEVLPALELLPHRVRVAAPGTHALSDFPQTEIVLLDARVEIAQMRTMSQTVQLTWPDVPVIAVFTEGGLVALHGEWQLSDIVLASAGPAEVDARIRMALTRGHASVDTAEPISAGVLTIQEDAYTARVEGTALDLTYKEFELLKHLAAHPGRVFTRAQLLQEVWGYDYFGGTRTVDVHVRRLRAKLGPEHEGMIGTVRNVGYRFVE